VKQDDVLPTIMRLVDGEIWKASHEQPPAVSQPRIDIHSKQIELINRKIDNLRDKIKSSDHEAIDILTDAVRKRRQLIQQQPTINPHHRQDMIDRWHELIEPMLIKTPTTKPSQTFNRIKNLFPNWTREQIRQLADEGDRLFNLADVHPSRVRQVLHDAGISVQFAFEPLEPHQSGKKRRLWRVKEAKTTMGNETFDLEQDKTCSAGPRERLTTSKPPSRDLRCNRWFATRLDPNYERLRLRQCILRDNQQQHRALGFRAWTFRALDVRLQPAG
jgi:hypothetical protein